MKTLIILTLLTLFSATVIAASSCHDLQAKLKQVESRLEAKPNSSTQTELRFQQKKLASLIEKNCVGLDKKIENAFMKSSLISN